MPSTKPKIYQRTNGRYSQDFHIRTTILKNGTSSSKNGGHSLTKKSQKQVEIEQIQNQIASFSPFSNGLKPASIKYKESKYSRIRNLGQTETIKKENEMEIERQLRKVDIKGDICDFGELKIEENAKKRENLDDQKKEIQRKVGKTKEGFLKSIRVNKKLRF